MHEFLSLTEEELKINIKNLYFQKLNYKNEKIGFLITQDMGNLGEINLLWAEAKEGKDSCLHKSLIQLILTIGKYRYNTGQTPKFLGAFDSQKFAFLPYASVQEIFYQNDIDWSVTPSNYQTPQFLSLLSKLEPIFEQEASLFSYKDQSKELQKFITQNITSNAVTLCEIDKNNFVSVYYKWLEAIKDTISIDWERAKQAGIHEADFYFADLLCTGNTSTTHMLCVILKDKHYEFNKKFSFSNIQSNETINFKDAQKAHSEFWSMYKQPHEEECWKYIIPRRNLLLSQDSRERKGAFFTPRIWVEKSQEYLAKALGENWQEEYYIWDCAGGTGNLLAGLSNPRNVFCSTLDQADVNAIKMRIKKGGDLIEEHIFQFDFLNDKFFDDTGYGPPPPFKDS